MMATMISGAHDHIAALQVLANVFQLKFEKRPYAALLLAPDGECVVSYSLGDFASPDYCDGQGSPLGGFDATVDHLRLYRATH